MCKTSAISDIVILVDGSWSIGRINFRLVRTFLENLVRAFNVEFDQTRIGEEVLISGFRSQSLQRYQIHQAEFEICKMSHKNIFCSQYWSIWLCVQAWLSTAETPESSGISTLTPPKRLWLMRWRTCHIKEETHWQVQNAANQFRRYFYTTQNVKDQFLCGHPAFIMKALLVLNIKL